jgi:hypothetical protein
MYNIKERQIERALKYHKERPNLIKLIEESGIRLSENEKENILIFGDIRGPYYLAFDNIISCYNPDEFSDYEVLKELLSDR